MFVEIGAYDAKTKLPEILRRVEAGEAFTITNRGKPVADLIPSNSDKTAKSRSAINNILKAKKHFVSDELLDNLKNDGRK